MQVAIVDLNGDYSKLLYELKELSVDSFLTKRENKLLKADKIIIPGSGEAYSAIKKMNLFNLGGVLKIVKKPVLGISLGMEILCEYSDEGNVFCLGCIPGRVKKIEGNTTGTPVEYFSKILVKRNNPLLSNVDLEEKFYFRHAYCVPDGDYTFAIIEERKTASAVIQNENYFGVQFFPERSGTAGQKVLENFLFKI